MEEVRAIPSKGGSLRIADTSAHTTDLPAEARVIKVIVAATFTALEEDGADVKTARGVTGATVAGEEIYAKTKFSKITLASGTVVVY
jgi:hypothetical protein